MSEAQNCTPPEELKRQIMSYNEPKNEREWWACFRIEKLETALREIEFLYSPQMRGKPRRVDIDDIARAALAGEKTK